jgi:hypothetical protein
VVPPDEVLGGPYRRFVREDVEQTEHLLEAVLVALCRHNSGAGSPALTNPAILDFIMTHR